MRGLLGGVWGLVWGVVDGVDYGFLDFVGKVWSDDVVARIVG